MSQPEMPVVSDVPAALSPIDPGNGDVLNPSHEITVTRGFVRLVDGTSIYVMTFRQGVTTFTVPFHGGPDAMTGLAQMLLADVQNMARPSGLIVPQVGTPIPTNLRRR